jgi:hypothetical protein
LAPAPKRAHPTKKVSFAAIIKYLMLCFEKLL